MSQTLAIAVPSPQAVNRESFAEWAAGEILRTTGPQPRCPRAREILESFWDRLGPDKALLACSLAFGRNGGFWRGAPVTPLRFQESQDEFFALPLLASGDGGE
jgi:hypothetical protein